MFQKTKKIVVIVSSKSINIRVDQKFKVSLKNIRDNVSCRKTKKQKKGTSLDILQMIYVVVEIKNKRDGMR